jgi:hypothetical protein
LPRKKGTKKAKKSPPHCRGGSGEIIYQNSFQIIIKIILVTQNQSFAFFYLSLLFLIISKLNPKGGEKVTKLLPQNNCKLIIQIEYQ